MEKPGTPSSNESSRAHQRLQRVRGSRSHYLLIICFPLAAKSLTNRGVFPFHPLPSKPSFPLRPYTVPTVSKCISPFWRWGWIPEQTVSVATTHMWLLSTWNMAGVTEEPHFFFFHFILFTLKNRYSIQLLENFLSILGATWTGELFSTINFIKSK